MICATLSGSAAGGARAVGSSAISVPWRSAVGPNSAATRRATLGRARPRSRRIWIASASSFERSSRSTVSFVSRSTCSRISPTNSARALRVGVVLVEQLDEPGEREDRRPQLVRGVGDELLASAVEDREPLLHLVEGHRELADLVGGVDRDRVREVAVGDLLGGALEPAQAAGVGAGDQLAGAERGEQRDRSGDQDLAADQRDVVVDVGRGRWRRLRSSVGWPSSSSGTAVSPSRSSPTPSTALAGEAVDQRRRGRRVAGGDGGPLELGVGDHERRLGPGRARADAEDASPGRRCAGRRRRAGPARRPSEAPSRIAAASLPLWSAATCSSRLQLLRGQAGAQLRDDVEVDEPDRRRRDHEEDERQPVADRVQRRNNSTEVLRFASGLGGSRFIRDLAKKPLVPEAVPHAAHREQVLGAPRVGLELLAQVADMDVDRARVAVGRVAPDAARAAPRGSSPCRARRRA